MKTIALYSIKGGVGKTASAVNLSYLASLEGEPCLLCDLDSQAASSYYFRVSPSRKYSSEKFLKGKNRMYDHIKATDFENLDLLPADFSYRNLDIELSEAKNPQKKLRKNLDGLSEDYRHVFFDCPPNLTLLSESIFSASDIILVPMVPTTLSVRTYAQLLDFFREHGLDRSKIRAFFTMAEKRKSMHAEIIEAHREAPGFLRQVIPNSAEVEKMGLYRAPLNAVRPRAAAAKAYRSLWQEIVAG